MYNKGLNLIKELIELRSRYVDMEIPIENPTHWAIGFEALRLYRAMVMDDLIAADAFSHTYKNGVEVFYGEHDTFGENCLVVSIEIDGIPRKMIFIDSDEDPDDNSFGVCTDDLTQCPMESSINILKNVIDRHLIEIDGNPRKMIFILN